MVRHSTAGAAGAAQQYVSMEMEDIPTLPSPPATPLRGVEPRVAEKIRNADETMNLRNCKIITCIWIVLTGLILFAAQARPSLKSKPQGDLHWSKEVLDMTGLASNLLQESVAKKNMSPRKCNVKTNGAVGDGVTLDTMAFSKAIRLCVGSGVVVVPSGTYALEYLHLGSQTSLMLQSGAVLLAGPKDEPPLSAVTYPFAPFITVKNASDVVIQGKGSIKGQGLHWVSRPLGSSEAFWSERLHSSPLVEVVGSREVLIKGVTLMDSTRNTLLIQESHLVVLEKIRTSDAVIDEEHSVILVEASKTVEMADSFISTNGGVAFGVRSSAAAPCKDVVLQRTAVTGGAGVGLLPAPSGTNLVQRVVLKDLKLDGRGTDARGNPRPHHKYGGLFVHAHIPRPPLLGVSVRSLPRLQLVEKVFFSGIEGHNLTHGIDLLVMNPLPRDAEDAVVFGNGNIDEEDEEEALVEAQGRKVQLSTIEFSGVSIDTPLQYQVTTRAPVSALVSDFNLQNVAFTNSQRYGWDCNAAIHGTAKDVKPPIPEKCALLAPEAAHKPSGADEIEGRRR